MIVLEAGRRDLGALAGFGRRHPSRTVVERVQEPADDEMGPGLGGRALHQAVGYMYANLGRRLSLTEIASAACMSRFHFARLFRQSTGYSAMEFLTLLRIHAGAKLLASGGTPIKVISQQLGFSDQSHFSRHFRKTMGVTPRAYSRLYRTGPSFHFLEQVSFARQRPQRRESDDGVLEDAAHPPHYLTMATEALPISNRWGELSWTWD